MRILVTGGAGYIGSHTCVELLNEGYEVVIVDNLYNANKKAVDRVEEITGKKVTFYEADICDKEAMDAIFDKEDVQAVIHFAGLKAVGESVKEPMKYYHNNLYSTINLCEVMKEFDCELWESYEEFDVIRIVTSFLTKLDDCKCLVEYINKLVK